MTGPRRVLIDADYAADGIWWVPSKEERESPISSYLTREHLQPWPLNQGLRDDLKAWNQSWEVSDGFWDSAEARRAWQEQGRELAIRAQNEFGTGDWEVLYKLGDRVHPPGSWPAETWEQDVLGYPSRERDMSVAAVVFTCQPKIAAAGWKRRTGRAACQLATETAEAVIRARLTLMSRAPLGAAGPDG